MTHLPLVAGDSPGAPALSTPRPDSGKNAR
jgi:hypothetical protein